MSVQGADQIRDSPSKSNKQRSVLSHDQLARKNGLTTYQMSELSQNHGDLIEKLIALSDEAVNLIGLHRFEEATVHLDTAERLMEYAAQSGKALERRVLIQILHNLAALSQKTGNLEKAAGYIEAIIFNLDTVLKSKENQNLQKQLQSLSATGKGGFDFRKKENEQMKACLGTKVELFRYWVRFLHLQSGAKNGEGMQSSCLEAVKLFLAISRPVALVYEWDHQEPWTTKVVAFMENLSSSFAEYSEGLHFELVQSEIETSVRLKESRELSFSKVLQKYSSLDENQNQHRYLTFSSEEAGSIETRLFQPPLPEQSQPGTPGFLQSIILEFSYTLYLLSSQTADSQILNLHRQVSCSAQTCSDTQAPVSAQQPHSLAENYHLLSLKICVTLFEDLCPFASECWEHYAAKYLHSNQIEQEVSHQIKGLRQKYRGYIPDSNEYFEGPSVQTQRETSNSSKNDNSYGFGDMYYSSPNEDYRLEFAPMSSREINNRLESLLKEHIESQSQSVSGAQPPELKFDISELESMEYAGSTLRQNNSQTENQIQTPSLTAKKQQNPTICPSSRISSLKVRTIKTMPDLSDLSQSSESSRKSRVSESMQKQKQRIDHKTSQIKNVKSPKNSKTHKQKPSKALQQRVHSDRLISSNFLTRSALTQNSRKRHKKNPAVQVYSQNKKIQGKEVEMNKKKAPRKFKTDKLVSGTHERDCAFNPLYEQLELTEKDESKQKMKPDLKPEKKEQQLVSKQNRAKFERVEKRATQIKEPSTKGTEKVKRVARKEQHMQKNKSHLSDVKSLSNMKSANSFPLKRKVEGKALNNCLGKRDRVVLKRESPKQKLAPAARGLQRIMPQCKKSSSKLTKYFATECGTSRNPQKSERSLAQEFKKKPKKSIKSNHESHSFQSLHLLKKAKLQSAQYVSSKALNQSFSKEK